MRHSDIQRQSASAVDSACRTSLALHHHEPMPTAESHWLDDAAESATPSWEHLWIDVGGEG
jgi:hypothetical protein